MIDYDATKNSVFDYLILATGLQEDQVRRAYQNASAQPAQDRGALVSFNLINQTSIGIDGATYLNDDTRDLDETTKGNRNVTVSIKTYSDNAEDIAEQIRLFSYSFAATNFMNKADIGIIRVGQILDISSIQNGNYENRRQLDIDIHIVNSITATVNAIESAEINFGFYGSSEITETIEVTE